MPLNLPNILTMSRIGSIPVIIGLMYLPSPLGNWAAFSVYTYACITDFFDGYLARVWQQQSSLGRFLDPIADKLLIAGVLLMLVANDHITGLTVAPAAVILFREILVSGLREFLGEVNVSVPVSNLAKWKTVMQMVAIGFLIAGPTGDKIFPWTSLTGLALLWVSATLTLYTGWDYFRAGVKHVLEQGLE